MILVVHLVPFLFLSENDIDGEALQLLDEEAINSMIKSVGLKVKFRKQFYELFPDKREIKEKSINVQAPSPDNPCNDREINIPHNEANVDDKESQKGLSSQFIAEKSKIYGLNNPNTHLTDWQKAVNKASYEICLLNNETVYNRAQLKVQAEAKARETYVFKKGTSRSKLSGEPSLKKAKLTTSERKEKISDLSAVLKLTEDQIKTNQKLLAKANDVKDYAQCAQLQKEIMGLFNKKVTVQQELKDHMKKESRSKSYFSKVMKSETSSVASSAVVDIRKLFSVKGKGNEEHKNSKESEVALIQPNEAEKRNDEKDNPIQGDKNTPENLPEMQPDDVINEKSTKKNTKLQQETSKEGTENSMLVDTALCAGEETNGEEGINPVCGEKVILGNLFEIQDDVAKAEDARNISTSTQEVNLEGEREEGKEGCYCLDTKSKATEDTEKEDQSFLLGGTPVLRQ